jgi:hypothetical protein
MPRKILQNRNIRKLFKTGGDSTYALTLPIEFIRDMKWQEGQKLVVEKDPENNKLIIKDWE